VPTIDFTLYLITDRTVVPPGRTLVEQVRAALEGGVKAVQLREKDLTAAHLYPLAVELRALTYDFGARLLLNDRLDIALAVGADGVHLGGHSLPVAVARRQLGPNKLLGVSTHRVEEIPAAADAGADFVTFGPVYPTPSKAAFGAPVGLPALAQACAAATLPVFALGGISAARIASVRQTGCRRIACIGAILNSDDPAAASRALLEQLTAPA
jgi:thiamine-phosphate pyrophosphorylase